MPHPSRPSWARVPAVGAIALGLTLVLSFPAVVRADADIVERIPADGATVEGTPTEIAIIFDEAVDAASYLALRDASGTELARGGPDPEDPAKLVIDDVPDLAPGDYEVRLSLSSTDGHLTRETWSFTVVAAPTPTPTAPPTPTPDPSATAAPTPASTPTPAPTTAPTSSPAPDGEPTASGSDVLIPIIAGLAIVAVAGGVLLSRRGRA